METSKYYSCKTIANGIEEIRMFEQPKDINDNDIPGLVEQLKQMGLPYGKSVSGNLGRSLFPKSTESISTDGKIHIIINSKGNINQRTIGIVHEFGHVILYLRGLPYQHPNLMVDRFIYSRSSTMSKRLGYDY